MANLVFAARRLAISNLGWFLITRTTLGEGAGNERAININKEVVGRWFPQRSPTDDTPIEIKTRYFDGSSNTPSTIVRDQRTIRMQGGGKNWRMAGNAITGSFYDVRVGDLMLMVFDQSDQTLSWVVIRKAGDPSRSVSSQEGNLHAEIESRLGPDKGSMWLIPTSKAAGLIQLLKGVFPKAGDLLMEQKAMMEAWVDALGDAGFIGSNNVSRRLLVALEAKRFAILSGLSGSGKTLLARLFAKWICGSAEQYALVSVGSNWTSNDNIVGYADALDSERYVATAALKLMLRADKYPDEPHFLILDEMNLSHVERYFSDLLSAIESPAEALRFHEDAAPRGEVPSHLPSLPSNFFVIGTVNVDETTYMFSPKVLDRANVIEFRAAREAMASFLSSPSKSNADTIVARGEAFGKGFVARANHPLVTGEISPSVAAILPDELLLLFDILARHEQEFGFRSAHEILRYVHLSRTGEGDVDWDAERSLLREAFDEQISQKILPRLHGARKRLEPILLELGSYCGTPRSWAATGAGDLTGVSGAAEIAVKTAALPATDPQDIFLPLSYEKIARLLERVRRNGFASFAEA